MQVRLRALRDDDGDPLFAVMADPAARAMAAFTDRAGQDRGAFDRWLHRVRTDPAVRAFAVEADDSFVGFAAVYNLGTAPEVTYWIDRASWGRGIAGAALGLLLAEVPVRPLLGGAACDNVASLTVLRRHGFRPVGRERAFAVGRGEEVEEVRLRLDAD